MAECGVTTALDMGHLPAAIQNAFRGQAGLADLRFAGSFATSSGSTHSRMGQLPKTHLVDSTGQAAQSVQEGIDEGADCIKMVVDIPGPTQDSRDPEHLGHRSAKARQTHRRARRAQRGVPDGARSEGRYRHPRSTAQGSRRACRGAHGERTARFRPHVGRR